MSTHKSLTCRTLWKKTERKSQTSLKTNAVQLKNYGSWNLKLKDWNHSANATTRDCSTFHSRQTRLMMTGLHKDFGTNPQPVLSFETLERELHRKGPPCWLPRIKRPTTTPDYRPLFQLERQDAGAPRQRGKETNRGQRHASSGRSHQQPTCTTSKGKRRRKTCVLQKRTTAYRSQTTKSERG